MVIFVVVFVVLCPLESTIVSIGVLADLCRREAGTTSLLAARSQVLLSVVCGVFKLALLDVELLVHDCRGWDSTISRRLHHSLCIVHLLTQTSLSFSCRRVRLPWLIRIGLSQQLNIRLRCTVEEDVLVAL